MERTTLATLLLALAGCAAPAAAQAPADARATSPLQAAPAPVPRTIVSRADGRVAVKPDVAIVQAGVQVTAKDPQKASADSAARMKTLLAELTRLGIADRDVQTSEFRLTAERPWENGRQLPVQGYTSACSLRIKVRKLEQLPALLGRLTAVGVNDIQSVQFGKDELGPARDEALALAVGAARARAETVARAAGVTLGDVLNIGIEPVNPAVPMGANVAALRAQPGEESPVAAGEIEVSAAVEMTFAIR